jgi:hypothetical protein
MKILAPQRSLSIVPLLVAFVPLSAFAAEPPDPDANALARSFGEARQLAVSGATQMQLDHTWSTYGGPGGSQDTFLGVSGSVDYFVVRGLSLGMRGAYEHVEQPGYPTGNAFAVGPRVGYDFSLAKQWSFWPDLYAQYGTAWGGTPSPARSLSVGAYAPILWHPVTHFFVGLGPEATTFAFLDQPTGNTTTVGLSATVGGSVDL